MSVAPRFRPPAHVVAAQPASDGAGVRLLRSLGTTALPMVDPFLMLDEFRSDDPGDYIAGFPSHPHRGFQTVTIMLAGSMKHEDSVGNTGHLGPGSVQWMTAGRGIIHSEMPKQEDGLMWGFQLWVNLPARDKMSEPTYQDLPPHEIPQVRLDDGRVVVRVVAGPLGDVVGPVRPGFTAPRLFDIRLDADGVFETELPPEHRGFVYPYEGSVRFEDGTVVARSHAAVLGEGDRLRLSATGGAARALLVAGRPIDEPVARYGPFVMNTREELEQAVLDYRRGVLAR